MEMKTTKKIILMRLEVTVCLIRTHKSHKMARSSDTQKISSSPSNHGRPVHQQERLDWAETLDIS